MTATLASAAATIAAILIFRLRDIFIGAAS